MRNLLLVPALLLALAACDAVQEDDSRTYRVKYDVAGTFEECTLTLNNRSDSIVQFDRKIPWSDEFTVEVREFSSFFATISALCTAEEEREVSVKLIVDGRTVDEGSGSGTFVSAGAEASLRLSGVEAD